MCVLAKEKKNKTACCSSYLFIKTKIAKIKKKRHDHEEKAHEEKQKCLIKVWPQGSFIRYAYKYQEEFVHRKLFNEYKSRIIN